MASAYNSGGRVAGTRRGPEVQGRTLRWFSLGRRRPNLSTSHNKRGLGPDVGAWERPALAPRNFGEPEAGARVGASGALGQVCTGDHTYSRFAKLLSMPQPLNRRGRGSRRNTGARPLQVTAPGEASREKGNALVEGLMRPGIDGTGKPSQGDLKRPFRTSWADRFGVGALKRTKGRTGPDGFGTLCTAVILA